MDDETVSLFLCGDVMTGRGVDQVFARSVEPLLREPYVKSARRYVDLAERANGPIPEPVEPSYPWGEFLEVLEREAPDARIVNLETAVTTSDEPWTGKGIHYRMHPANVACLQAAQVDACVLANNHVLDWGYAGLEETLETLRDGGLRTAGAGDDLREARAPAVVAAAPGESGGRVLVFALGHGTAGIPRSWAASEETAGVWRLPDLSAETAGRVAARIEETRAEGDRVVVSLHWGGNWGYRVPQEQRRFARRLIDAAGVDVVHGHSSHHPKGMEVYAGRLVLYGCGDFLNDYEGIGGHEEYRPDLVLAYLATLNAADGRLVRLEMVPMELRRFRLERAGEEEVEWLRRTLDRECRELGSRVERVGDGRLELVSDGSAAAG